jgi:hypothetical protein
MRHKEPSVALVTVRDFDHAAVPRFSAPAHPHERRDYQPRHGSGLPPEKWSSLRYGSREQKEDVSDVEEEAQA